MLKKFIKKLTPRFALNLYHRALALLAAVIYGFPAEKLIVIGVTGTSGKTTTSYLATQLLELTGSKVGLTSTAIFKVGEKEWLNDKKMTMLGRFQTQKLLADMVRAGCKYAVVETSSEGIKQFRHRYINYDILVFTNLKPEHLEAHGGFENYKKAKLELFRHLEKSNRKTLNNQKIEKTIIANGDDEHVADFLNFEVEKKIIYGNKISNLKVQSSNQVLISKFQILNSIISSSGTDFTINDIQFHSPLPGDFNIYNNTAAIAVLNSQNIPLEKIAALLPQTKPCPGRLELINEGQNFTVIVDYAFEPNAMRKLYEAMKLFPHNKLIHVFGATGGGRDRARRPILGELAGHGADYVVVTDDDPYDDDPMMIINEVAAGAVAAGKIEGQNLLKILDRREAIGKALSLAHENDLVLITGKGSEQAMCFENGKMLPWDDRQVAREGIKLLRK